MSEHYVITMKVTVDPGGEPPVSVESHLRAAVVQAVEHECMFTDLGDLIVEDCDILVERDPNDFR